MISKMFSCFFPQKAFCTPDLYCCFPKFCGNKHTEREEHEEQLIRLENSADMSFNELAESLKEMRYLPTLKDKNIRLVYLALLSEEPKRSPFTAAQKNIIDASDHSNRITACCLNIGVFLTPLLACSTLIGLMGLNIAIPPTALVITPVASGAVFSSCNSLFSFIATGTNPDDSSVKANTKQNILHGQIQEIFNNAAMDLVDLKETQPTLALEIAQHLNIAALQKVIEEASFEENFEGLVLPLKTAQCYVLNQNLGFQPSSLIRSYVGRA